jgi:hypothetical protein
MPDWDSTLYDPTSQPSDGFRIYSSGGRSGPLALENGAKISFPWARQQQAGGTPGEIWVREGTDPTNSLDAHTLFVVGADVNDQDDGARPKLRLDSYWANGEKSSASLQAGDAVSSLQTRVRVSNQRIDLETIPLTTTGGAVDGEIAASGRMRLHSATVAAPSTTLAANPLVVGARPLVGPGSWPNGAQLVLGHNWIQAATTVLPTTLAFTPALNLQPSGGEVQIAGAALTGLTGAWTAWAPVISQGAVTHIYTNHYSRYIKIGRTVHWSFILTMTTAGTANPVIMTLPVAAAGFAGNRSIGSGYIYPNAAPNVFGQFLLNTLTTVAFGLPAGFYSTSMSTGHVITGTVTYEAAS